MSRLKLRDEELRKNLIHIRLNDSEELMVYRAMEKAQTLLSSRATAVFARNILLARVKEMLTANTGA